MLFSSFLHSLFSIFGFCRTKQLQNKSQQTKKSKVINTTKLEYVVTGGTKWTEPCEFGPGKLKSHNIQRISRTSFICKKKYTKSSSASAWRLLIDKNIMEHIITCTLSKVTHCINLRILFLQKIIRRIFSNNVCYRNIWQSWTMWLWTLG